MASGQYTYWKTFSTEFTAFDLDMQMSFEMEPVLKRVDARDLTWITYIPQIVMPWVTLELHEYQGLWADILNAAATFWFKSNIEAAGDKNPTGTHVLSLKAYNRPFDTFSPLQVCIHHLFVTLTALRMFK